MGAVRNQPDPISNERRWTRAAWLTLAVVLVWIVYAIGFTQWATQIPQDGWTQNGPLGPNGAFEVQYNLSGSPSPLQKGDRIVAINGHFLTNSTFPPLPSGLQAGQTLRYTIQRGDKTMDVDVRLVQNDAWVLVRGFIERWRETPRDFLVSLISVLVVAFAFFIRPGNMGARYLFLFFGFYFAVQWFGFAVSQLYMFSTSPAAYFVYSFMPNSWGAYFFPTLILLALAFPVVKAPLRRFPRLLPALVYGIPLAVSITLVILQLVTHDLSWQTAFTPFFISILAASLIAIFVSLIHSWIRVREPVARAQLLWTTLGLGAGLGLMFFFLIVESIVFGRILSEFDFLLWMPVILPICLAIAITRYHLFDIELIIRRTLAYGVLTAALGLVYFGSIVILQQLLGSVAGESSIAIVISTLLIAALFTPLRRRVQGFVDRRFYRQKYDAARALESFSDAARNQVKFEHLTRQLVNVVEETIQPDKISLWLSAQKDLTRRTK